MMNTARSQDHALKTDLRSYQHCGYQGQDCPGYSHAYAPDSTAPADVPTPLLGVAVPEIHARANGLLRVVGINQAPAAGRPAVHGDIGAPGLNREIDRHFNVRGHREGRTIDGDRRDADLPDTLALFIADAKPVAPARDFAP